MVCSRIRPLLISVLVLPLCGAVADAQPFRTIDGSGNHLTDTTMGSTGTPLLRMCPSDYADSVSTPAGADRPSPRLVSNLVCAQGGSVPNSVDASDFLWQWGQFVDHDIDLTPTDGSPPDSDMPIPVPMGDPWFDPMSTGSQSIGFTRSVFLPGSSPREQLNEITAWIDASNVYGSDPVRADALRTNDGTGRLRTSAGDLLPYNDVGLPNAQVGGVPADVFFLAGDERANEQIALTSMHTLFVREHNRLATEIALADPLLSGDDIYLRARRIVGAQMQKITYDEFLPVLLGPSALDPWTAYDPAVNGSIRNIFSTACYRVGHTMLSSRILRLDEYGMESPDGHLPLANAFFAPHILTLEGGIEPILRGLAFQRAQEIDTQVVDAVRNFLFGPPGAGGFDLASLNLQRGRDHGLPGYNSARVALGLAAVTTFAGVTSDPAVQQALADAYDTVDDIDAWVGGLAEDPVPGSMVGELIHTVLVEQFTALRDGDRYWYQNDLIGAELAEVEETTLSDIIVRNTTIDSMPDDVFRVIEAEFVRGDCNADALYDIGDTIFTLNFLFANGDSAACADACDANDDGSIDVADGVFTLMALFQGGAQPAAPHPACGPDATGDDGLPCVSFGVCP